VTEIEYGENTKRLRSLRAREVELVAELGEVRDLIAMYEARLPRCRCSSIAAYHADDCPVPGHVGRKGARCG
jgi:hypothetical protein